MSARPVDSQPVGKGAYLAWLAVADGCDSVRSVQQYLGLESPSTAHAYLANAKAAGLVSWEPGKAGTLRVLMREVSL